MKIATKAIFCSYQSNILMTETKDSKRVSKGNRVIVLPMQQNQYAQFLSNLKFARNLVLTQLDLYPQIFPANMESFSFNGTTNVSKKMSIRKRKIVVDNIHYQIHPSFILPDMRGMINSKISNGLLLCAHGVPFWLVSRCFGENESYWFRLYQSFSQKDIVGSTVYGNKDNIPEDILVDEKHISISKQKYYIGTTVGGGCILGAEISESADEQGLMKAYNVFKTEALEVKSDYQPKSINTDGWVPTINAIKKLFPLAIMIRCFLHAFLKIRNNARKSVQEEFNRCSDIVWNAYRSEDKRSFSQRIRRIREWSVKNMKDNKMKIAVLKLCDRKEEFMAYFDNKLAHRTSNMLDRLMRLMDRKIFKAQGFHGSKKASNKTIRTYAILYNFAPSCPKAGHKELKSPAERLNGFAFSEDWVENLLIASSLNGKKHYHLILK